ncbi:MAG: paraquat-inducible protein A [Cellvibrionales bacterium]|nr:paraquat-inducible protein A [Cellvibrionales bacterium]
MICSRCGKHLLCHAGNYINKVIALSATSLILFVYLFSFTFISIEFKGLSNQIYLLDTVKNLFYFHYPLVALIFSISVIFLPLAFCLSSLILFIRIKHNRLKRRHKWLCHFIFMAKHWLMADVFLVGVLVSMVKMGDIGDVHLSVGFYLFFLLIVCMVYLSVTISKLSTWIHFFSDNPLSLSHPSLCKGCHFLKEEGKACNCCGKKTPDLPNNVTTSWVFLVTALLCYLPANVLPIMITIAPQQKLNSTILGGISVLWDMHSYWVAIIILVASIIIPIAKIAILAVIFWETQKQKKLDKKIVKQQTLLFNITQFIGRWSFIDVFVVALLSALVQLKSLAVIEPGSALIPFTAVVILTMLSARSFDSRVIWRNMHLDHDG